MFEGKYFARRTENYGPTTGFLNDLGFSKAQVFKNMGQTWDLLGFDLGLFLGFCLTKMPVVA